MSVLIKEKEQGTVVKADLVDRVYERMGFTREEAAKAVEVLLGEIKTVLARGENVRIVGFASFNLRQKRSRKARNPKTGEAVLIEARTVLTFKPSRHLLEATNRATHEPGHS